MSIFEKIREKLEERRQLHKDLSKSEKLTKEEKLNQTRYDGCFCKAIEIVNQVEREHHNGWIPCAAGLPPVPEPNPVFSNKPLELYLVTEAYVPYPCRAFWNGRCFTDGISIINAVAWQPLPKAYIKEEAKNEVNQS